jgi:hypothetical protein
MPEQWAHPLEDLGGRQAARSEVCPDLGQPSGLGFLAYQVQAVGQRVTPRCPASCRFETGQP